MNCALVGADLHAGVRVRARRLAQRRLRRMLAHASGRRGSRSSSSSSAVLRFAMVVLSLQGTVVARLRRRPSARGAARRQPAATARGDSPFRR